MIIWLASYPKSGNTWVRAFLGSYLHGLQDKFKFNFIEKIGEFPDHNILGKIMDNKDFHNLKEVSKNWINVQELINQNDKINFLKTHNALCNINGNIFTNKANTIAFIYVVRDPRNVILSMSNHFDETQEECFKTITNERHIIFNRMNNELLPASFMGSWANHYLSWKNSTSINNIIIKYEDLINDGKNTFSKLINFLSKYSDIKYDEKKIINSINCTSFESLQKYEDSHGFNMGQKNKFFHLGNKNNWKNLLNPKIVNKINSCFKIEMSELGYL
jgi:hypothetical protein